MTARVLDLRLRLQAGVGKRAFEVGDLGLGGAPQLVGMPLRGVADVGKLGMSFLPNLGHGGLSGLGDGPVAFVGGGAQQFLRKGPKVGFEVAPDASERAIESLADLIVERHVRIIRRNPLSLCGFRLYAAALDAPT